MTDSSESAFARWLRLKRQQSVEAAARSQGGTAKTRPSSKDAAETASSDQPKFSSEGETPSHFPESTSLAKDSDSTLNRGDTPEEWHPLALRAMWRSDPIFSERDGLTAYDEDYTAIGKVEQAVRTVYRVGEGYLGDELPNGSAQSVPSDSEPSAAKPADPGCTNDAETPPDSAGETSTRNGPRQT